MKKRANFICQQNEVNQWQIGHAWSVGYIQVGLIWTVFRVVHNLTEEFWIRENHLRELFYRQKLNWFGRQSLICTGCSIMIAPPSTAKTSKTLAKLSLYYNSLNKVILLCKVSDWCVLFSLKNLNYLLTTCYVLWVTCCDVHDNACDDVGGLLIFLYRIVIFVTKQMEAAEANIYRGGL